MWCFTSSGTLWRNFSLTTKQSSQIGLLILYQFGDATQIAFANNLRGIAHVKPIMNRAFVAYIVIGIPVMYMLCFPIGLKISGIYLAHTISLLTAGALFYLTFRTRIKELAR